MCYNCSGGIMNIIMHIDVNNAFLSWTAVYLLKNGYKEDIRYQEAVIGGDESTRHGIVLAKSMVAKSRGVKTAETIKEAKRKCNNLHIYPPYYKLYKYMSNNLFKLISSYIPDIEILSIDECFADYGKVKKIYGDEVKFAYKLKKEIKEKLGFTVNIGIANNKLCAKMASDFLKPDRVHTLYSNEIESKMYPLPIEKLFGVGKKTAIKLRSIDINTIGDLANADINNLSKYFKNQASKLINSAKGISDTAITLKNKDVSISNSTTLSYNINHLEDMYPVIQSLVDRACITLRKKGKYAGVVGITLKDKFFKTKSHQKRLSNVVNDTNIIYKEIKKLAKELYNDESIRLIGVSLSKLTDTNNYQISMFEDINDKDKDDNLNKIMDELKSTYGSKIINNASLFSSNKYKKD